jgi:hypothetical protein
VYSRVIATTFDGSVTASLFSGSSSGLTNLNVSNILTGTLNDARIPTLAISKTSGLQVALDSKQATLTGTSIVNVSDLTTPFLTTTKMNGVKNTTFLTSFQNICSSTNFIKTTGLDVSTNKIVYTTTGIYRSGRKLCTLNI